eukprot:scaffold1633_cov179-Skeletonema_dohrnii-CCMP3373.AAC.4
MRTIIVSDALFVFVHQIYDADGIVISCSSSRQKQKNVNATIIDSSSRFIDADAGRRSEVKCLLSRVSGDGARERCKIEDRCVSPQVGVRLGCVRLVDLPGARNKNQTQTHNHNINSSQHQRVNITLGPTPTAIAIELEEDDDQDDEASPPRRLCPCPCRGCLSPVSAASSTTTIAYDSDSDDCRGNLHGLP